MEGTLIFIHIPKTAGTTFYRVMEREYDPEVTYHVDPFDVKNSLNRFKELPEKVRSSYELIRGHLTWGLSEQIPAPSKYVTFLRDPLSHVVSSYNYQLEKVHNRYHERVRSLNSIEEYLEFLEEEGIDNLQTRHLGDGVHHLDPERSFISMKEEGERIKETALERLNGLIDLVLISEYFDESLIFLEKTLGWPKRPFYSKSNISKKQITIKDLSQDNIDRIRELNRFDVEVYKAARKRFFELIHGLDIDLDKEVRKFRRQNKLRRIKSIFNPKTGG